MDEVLSILKAIDAHCRESLVEFSLNYRGCNVNNVFKQFTRPFKNVEDLSLELYNTNEQTEDHQLRFNKVFPNIRQLNIDFNRLGGSPLIGCELPKLDNLEIGSSFGYNYELNEPILIDLLKRNPQITHLSLHRPPFQVFQYVKKYLISLKELIINELIEVGTNSEKIEEISLPTVNSLDLLIFQENCRPTNRILFNANVLREISLGCKSGRQNDDYVNFLLKYPKIQKLGAGSGLHNEILLKLIGKFPELFYAAFDFAEDVTVNNIIEFIKQAPSLNQLEFVHANITDFDAFENQLEAKFDRKLDFNLKFSNETLPYSKTIIKKISIERKIPIWIRSQEAGSGAFLCCNVIYNTVVMFMMATCFVRFLSI